MGSTNGGEFIRAIETSLNDLGYVVESNIFNSVDFGGPQIRKRLFFIPRYYMQARYGCTFTKPKEVRIYCYFADAILFRDGALWREA